MTDRAVHYYQTPVDPAFAEHMIDGIGLSQRDSEIAWRFRNLTGDTQFYADLAKMPKKRFCAVAAGIHMREMQELLRLAQIGWRTEQQR